MDEPKLPDYFSNMFQQIEDAQKGKFFMVTLIGKVTTVPIIDRDIKIDKPGIALPVKEIDERAVYFDKPRRKLIKAQHIESIEEHEKGSVITMHGLGGGSLIVEENIELLIINAGIKLEQ